MEALKPKPFWKSKTVISAAIMLLTFIVDAAFQLGISDTIDSQLNAIFSTNEAGEIVKINWSALITLASMLALRFVSKKPVTMRLNTGAPNNSKGLKFLDALKNANKRK